MPPKVSVVMSVLNGEEFLRPAIDSVISQTFEDWELLIIDNGSTDRTAEILDSYVDPRIVRLRNEKTLPLPVSFNKGLAAAKAPLVARLDADDIAEPTRFEKQVAYLAAHPEICVLGTRWRELYPDGRLLAVQPVPTNHEEIIERFAYANPFVHSSLMYRLQPVMAVGGYRPDYHIAQDLALYLDLLPTHRFAILDEELVQLRLHPQQTTLRPQSLLARFGENEALFRRALKTLPLGPQARRRGWQALASARVYKGMALWRAHRPGAALASWLGAIAADPKSCLTVGAVRLFRRVMSVF